MAENPIRRFSIIVGSNGNITVERDAESADIKPCQVNCDEVQRQTIQVLITMLREGRLQGEEEFKVLGANLYKVLFNNPIGEAVTKVLIDPNQPLQFIRLELEFEKGQEVLSSWPWEFLYCPQEYGETGSGYFIANQLKLVLARRLRVSVKRSLRINKPPLKLLFVASSPKNMNIEYGKVLEVIEGLGPDMIKVTSLLPYETDGRTAKATWQNFTAMLETEEFHAIHFVGHGLWDSATKAGKILFMKKNGEPDPRSDETLANTLMESRELRLVFLQACESAQSDPYQAFSGVAQQLAQKGIPAVVGMQYNILQEVANRFASAFYEALALKVTVDAAVQKARRTVSNESSEEAQRRGFGLPVLYLRESESLFGPSAPAVGQDKGLSEMMNCPWPGCTGRNAAIDNFCGECTGTLVCECGTRVDRPRKTCGKCNKPLTPGKIELASSPSSPLLEGDSFSKPATLSKGTVS